jgi:FAD/FMN-containing dehydrogenase
VSYAEFQCALDDPPGYRNWWTAEHLAELADPAVDVLVDRARQLPAGPSMLCVFCWGGAIARVPAGTTPLAGRDARFVVHPLMLWEDPADDARALAHGRAYRTDVRPWATGATYLNFIGDEGRGRVQAGFAPGAHERLARVKARWDPDNVFRGNQNIRPAGKAAGTA